MKKILFTLLCCFSINFCDATTVEQFDKEQVAYKMELHDTARKAGYDPTSSKSISEQYKEKKLREKTVKSLQKVQADIQREIERDRWYRRNKSLIVSFTTLFGILLLLVILNTSKHMRRKNNKQ